ALGRRIAVEASGSVKSRVNGSGGSASAAHPKGLGNPQDAHWSALALLICIGMFKLPRGENLHKRLRQSAVFVGVFGLLISNGSVVVAQTSTAVCSTTGAQNTVVLLVTFPGVAPPANVTQQSVHDIFFSPSGHSLDGFWREASYGRTSAAGDVFGW